jgi:hypothetical protein
MANEINIQASLTVQKFSPATQGTGNKDITQTNSCACSNIQSLGTGTGQALELGVITSNLGYLFVKNLDATNNALLTLDSANAQVFALLRPSEFCLVPVNQNTLYGKSSASTVSVLVCACQT